MRLFANILAFSIVVTSSTFAPSIALGLESKPESIVDTWQGFATARGGQQVPISISISGRGSNLKAAFLNGPADHPDATPASSVTSNGTHLIASFDHFARTLDATLTDGVLTGTYAGCQAR
jgi:hypothetical protein